MGRSISPMCETTVTGGSPRAAPRLIVPMSLRLAIPRRVALQQSSRPLHQPTVILKQKERLEKENPLNGKCASFRLSQLRGSPQKPVLLHYVSDMPANYCEVALPVPLRLAFTYAIPDRLAGSIFAGSRVLVPFRNRAMTGVVVEVPSRRPDPARVKTVKEIVEALDPIPALTPKLLELGRWVGGYYVAPLGEVFRAMLPPQVDLRHERELLLTDAGRVRRDELAAAGNRSESEIAELALLSLMEIENRPVRADRLRKLPGGEAAGERLLRRKQIETRDVMVR